MNPLHTEFWRKQEKKKNIYIYIYQVYSSIDPIQSAQYVSGAEYRMVVKEKRLLQHYLYNAVS